MMHQWVVVMALVLLCQPAAAFSQDEGEVRRSLRDAFASYGHLEMLASTYTEYASDNGDPPDTRTSILYVTVKRDETRALLSTTLLVDEPGGDTLRAQKDFVIYENGDVLGCQADIDSSLKQIDGQSGLALELSSGRLAGTQDLDRESVYSSLNDSGAALWVVGYQPLRNYLDSASNVQFAQSHGGTEIRATGEYGRMTMTVSAGSGWLPQSFEIVKEPEHRTIRGRVGEVYENAVSPKSGPARPTDSSTIPGVAGRRRKCTSVDEPTGWRNLRKSSTRQFASSRSRSIHH